MIFISYRREDAEDLAYALGDKLVDRYGQDEVFIDRRHIEPGEQWRVRIDKALSKATVVLAVIGPQWIRASDEFGRRRIDSEGDVLAYELAFSLTAAVGGRIKVIPLYIHGAKPPPEEALPSRLVRLSSQQGMPFDIAKDLPELIQAIEKHPGAPRREGKAGEVEGGSMPSGQARPWSIPDSIGSLFKGREQALKDLRSRFVEEDRTRSGNVAKRQVIHGLGGIGKTRLAIEYAWTYQAEYSALMFVVGDTPDQLRRSMAELSGPGVLNLPESKCPEEDVRLAAVTRWLAGHPGWLLIIDNVDDADEMKSVQAVEKLLPTLRNGHVIITSRYKRWNNVGLAELYVLPLEAAKQFLLDRTCDGRRHTPQDETIAAELANELGGLALALEQAGAYIKNREGGLSLADYLSRWKEGREAVIGWRDQHDPQNRSVAITWETTTRALDPSALTLFRLLAWFAPDPIPRAMVSTAGVVEVIREAMEHTGLSQAVIDPEEALSELIAYSMTRRIQEQGVECVGLHRLVLQIMRERMPKEAHVPTVVGAAKILELFAPKDSYRPEKWMDWRLLISHAEAIWGIMEKLEEKHWNLELMKMLALYYMGQGTHGGGEPLQRKVLRLVEQRLPADDPELFLAMNDLALMLPSGEEKVKLFREALSGRIRVLGEISTDAAETQSNLGSHLRHEKPAEAEDLLRKSLSTHTKIDGPNHWRSLMAESSLAALLIARGDAMGEKMIRDNIAKKKKHLGDDHPDTLGSMRVLVGSLISREDLDGAAALQQEILKNCTDSLGADKETVDLIKTSATRDLASIMAEKGDVKSATEHWAMTSPHWKLELQRLEAKEADLKPDSDAMKQHAVDLNNCAVGLRQSGLLEQAEAALRKALEITEGEFRTGSPKIPHRLMNLGTILTMRDKLTEATEVLDRAWRIQEKGHDVTSLRVLFLQYVVALLLAKDGDFYLRALKTLLLGKPLTVHGNIAAVWDIQYLLVFLRNRLPAETADFLGAIIKALNDKAKAKALDRYGAWAQLQPVVPAESGQKKPEPQP